jgi:hypothetical protein
MLTPELQVRLINAPEPICFVADKLTLQAFDGKRWYWVDDSGNLHASSARDFVQLVRPLYGNDPHRKGIRGFILQLKSYFWDSSYKPF